MTQTAAQDAWFLHACLWAAFVVMCGAAALPLCSRLFRSLPDPLFTYALYSPFIITQGASRRSARLETAG